MPGLADTAVFATGAARPYMVTTGVAAQSVGSLVLADRSLTLSVTGRLSSSRTNYDANGTIAVAAGGVLAGPAIRQVVGSSDLEIAAGGLVTLAGTPTVSGASAVFVVGTANVNGGTLDAGGNGTSANTGGYIAVGDGGSKTPTVMTATAGATVKATYT